MHVETHFRSWQNRGEVIKMGRYGCRPTPKKMVNEYETLSFQVWRRRKRNKVNTDEDKRRRWIGLREREGKNGGKRRNKWRKEKE